jgi:outer membrane protein OmpA-like peptidoglycan-associated protein
VPVAARRVCGSNVGTMADFDFPSYPSPFTQSVPPDASTPDHEAEQGYLFPLPDEVCSVEGPWDLEVGPVRAVPPSEGDLDDVRRYEQVVPRDLHFDSDSAAIRPREQFALSGFASSLAGRELALRVQVVGHTDSNGSDEHNVALSEARAMAVGKYLTRHDVLVNVELEGHGEREPVASNDTEQGREANRRVEIRLLPVVDPR